MNGSIHTFHCLSFYRFCCYKLDPLPYIIPSIWNNCYIIFTTALLKPLVTCSNHIELLPFIGDRVAGILIYRLWIPGNVPTVSHVPLLTLTQFGCLSCHQLLIPWHRWRRGSSARLRRWMNQIKFNIIIIGDSCSNHITVINILVAILVKIAKSMITYVMQSNIPIHL